MSSYFKTTQFFRACLLGGIASIITAFAQNQTVRLSGKITDPSGAAVARAIVKLDNRDTSENFSSITDDGGNFSFSVPRGQYLLRAEAPGLTLGKSPQILALSNTQAISLRLTIPAVTSAVVVTGTGTPQSLDETEKAVDIVDRDQLQRRSIESTVDALR